MYVIPFPLKTSCSVKFKRTGKIKGDFELLTVLFDTSDSRECSEYVHVFFIAIFSKSSLCVPLIINSF